MVPNALQAVSAYVIPPLLGFIVLLGLALISLLRGGRKRTNILFAGICLLGALLNADVALVSILPDERLALRIDRTVHFFFVFSVPDLHPVRPCISGHPRPKVAGDSRLAVQHRFSDHRSHRSLLQRVPSLFLRSDRPRRRAVSPFSATVAFTVIYCLAVLYRAMKESTDNHRETGSSTSSEGWGFPPSCSPSQSFRSAAFPSTRWGISASSPPFFSPSAFSSMTFWTSAP